MKGVTPLLFIVIALASSIVFGSCSNQAGSSKSLSEKEYAKLINDHLNGLDEELANQMKLVTSKQADAKSVKKHQDFIWEEQLSIAAIAPPDKFIEDNKKILKIYRTYHKSAQKLLLYHTNGENSYLGEASDLAMDAIELFEDLEYFNDHGEYREK